MFFKKRGSPKSSLKNKTLICEVCGHENHVGTIQCHKCNTSLVKDPWYRRLNLFARVQKSEADIKKLRLTIITLYQRNE